MSDDPVAVILTTGSQIEWCFASKELRHVARLFHDGRGAEDHRYLALQRSRKTFPLARNKNPISALDLGLDSKV